MAYSYTFVDLFDGASVAYVKCNVNQTLGSLIGPGTTLQFTGEAYAKNYAIKAILLEIDAYWPSAKYNGSSYQSEYMACVTYLNQSIAKGTKGTFTLNWTIPLAFWQAVKALAEDTSTGEQSTSDQLRLEWNFLLSKKAGTASLIRYSEDNPAIDDDDEEIYNYMVVNTMAGGGSRWHFNMFKSAPTPLSISSADFTDAAAVPAPPVFGGFATGHSIPRMDAAFTVDSAHYPGTTVSHKLTLTGAIEGEYSASTSGSTSSQAFSLTTPTSPGTVAWAYTIRDLFGQEASASGSFEVLAYNPPNISSFHPERYSLVQDAGGTVAVKSDDGTHIWLSLAATVAAMNGLNPWDASLSIWRTGRPEPEAVSGSIVWEDEDNITTQHEWLFEGNDGGTFTLSRDGTALEHIQLSDAYDWRMRLTVFDALGNSATLIVDDIVKSTAVMDLQPYGLAVGMRSLASVTDKCFEVAADHTAYFYGKSNIFPVGAIYISVSEENPGKYFVGTWASFGAGRVLIGVNANDTDFSAALKTGGQKTHKLTVSEMPAHAHEPSNVNTAGSDKNYKRNFTTNLHMSSDSVARIKVTMSSSASARSAIAATDVDDLAGVQKTTSVGGSTAHNNLQPYITVFMWRRTA